MRTFFILKSFLVRSLKFSNFQIFQSVRFRNANFISIAYKSKVLSSRILVCVRQQMLLITFFKLSWILFFLSHSLRSEALINAQFDELFLFHSYSLHCLVDSRMSWQWLTFLLINFKHRPFYFMGQLNGLYL